MELCKKNKKILSPAAQIGLKKVDAWTYTCVKRSTYFFVAFSVGKRTQESCRRMMKKVFERTEQPSPQTKMEMFTDGNDDYTYVLPEYCADACLEYGQLVKIKENWRVVRKEKRIIYGNPDLGDMETTDVENYNGILRERTGRLVRKTKCFSKRKRMLECSLHVFQFYWNFINEFKRRTSLQCWKDW